METKQESRQLYGFYSETAAREIGTLFYSSDIGEVEVTAVYTSPDWPNYNFRDKLMVGKVGGFLYKGRFGRREF